MRTWCCRHLQPIHPLSIEVMVCFCRVHSQPGIPVNGSLTRYIPVYYGQPIIWEQQDCSPAGLTHLASAVLPDCTKNAICNYGPAIERQFLGFLRKRSHKNLFQWLCTDEYLQYRTTGKRRRMLFRLCRRSENYFRHSKSDRFQYRRDQNDEGGI